LAFLYAISGVITLIESTVSSDKPGGITNLSGKILSPILTSTFFWTFFIIALFLSMFNSWWSGLKCFINVSEVDGSYQFWRYQSDKSARNVTTISSSRTSVSSELNIMIQITYLWVSVFIRWFFGFCFGSMCIWIGIFIAMWITFNTISKIFSSSGCFYIDGEYKQFTWWNTIKWLLPIFCFTRWWVFIPLLYAIVIVALCVHPPLGGGVFLCLTVCVFLFRKKLQELKDSYLKMVFDAHDKNKDIVNEKIVLPPSTRNIEPVECKDITEKIKNREIKINPAIKDKSKISERVEESKLIDNSPPKSSTSPTTINTDDSLGIFIIKKLYLNFRWKLIVSKFISYQQRKTLWKVCG
jgi:hypothetical protein